jgi:hypothetical protein
MPAAVLENDMKKEKGSMLAVWRDPSREVTRNFFARPWILLVAIL